MKILAFVFLSLIAHQALAQQQQRITIIDKNDENALLFDERNPESLVSLFNSNPLPLHPMKSETADRLEEKGFLDNTPIRYGKRSYSPLANTHGEDSMARINGVLQFVYPMPEIYHIDLKNISRLVLYEHQTGKNEFVIDSIACAKKYTENGKYELVGTIDFRSIDSQFELFYTEQISSVSLEKLLLNGFWTQLMTYQLAENPIQTNPVLNWNSILSVDHYPFIFQLLQKNRPKGAFWSYPDLNWPIQSNGIRNNRLSEYEKIYPPDKIHGMKEEEQDFPLSDMYGNDSIVILNGVMQFVYPEPDFHISWIDVSPTKAWLVRSVSPDLSNGQNNLLRIVFTQGETNVLMADMDCTDPKVDSLYRQLIEEAGIPFQLPVNETWKTTLLKMQTTGKHYYPDKKRDLKTLRKELQEN